MTIDHLRSLVFTVFDRIVNDDYLVEAFGMECGDVDGEWVDGTEGLIEDRLFLALRRPVKLWPYRKFDGNYDEDTLFDVIEFLHDYVSKPVEGNYHDFYHHMHWNTFDKAAGQARFRQEINEVLQHVDDPVALGDDGHIRYVPDEGFDQMLEAKFPPGTPEEVQARVGAAIADFKASRSTDDLRHAVRDLADALEKVRSDAKTILHRKDEAALFNIYNNFGIRHLDDDQKLDYEPAPFQRWLFYVSLATIHLILRLAERSGGSLVLSDLQASWSQVLDKLERDAPATRGFLDGSAVNDLTDEGLVVTVTSAMRASMLGTRDNRSRVEEAVKAVTGDELAATFVGPPRQS